MSKQLNSLKNNALKWIYISLLPLFFGACNHTLPTAGSRNLPPIPVGKARIIHILDNDPSMWKITPMYISVDGHPRTRASVNKISVIHVEPGQRLISYNQDKVLGSKDGVSLYFMRGQTRYLYCKAIRLSVGASYRIDEYKLDVTELDPFHASEELKKIEVLQDYAR